MKILKLLLSSIIVLLPWHVSSETILNNTFDSGKYDDIYRQYSKKQCSSSLDYINNSLFKFVSSPVRSGRLAMQHHLNNCDERSELGINPGLLREGEEYWIGWSYFVPDGFLKPVNGKPELSIIQQMIYQSSFVDQRQGVTLFECNQKSTKNGKLITRGAPGSHLTISPRGNMFQYSVSSYKGQDSQGRYIFGCKNFSLPARLNKWEDFVMNVKPSSDSEQGFVKIWKNGQLFVNEKLALLRPGINALGAWKIGVYVGDPGHGERLLYTDELKVGDGNSSFEAVSPQNH